jgi:hypothetical protein
VRTLERSIIAKSGNADVCEDGIVVTDHYAAVVDGATDKTGARYDGMAGGRFAMRIVVDVIAGLPDGLDVDDVIRRLTEALAQHIPADLAPENRPSAAATIYSVSRREIWQIGDVGFWFEGLERTQPHKLVDRINSQMRAAVLTAELLRGTPPEELSDRDPGRAAILPLLTVQGLFANNAEAGQLGYSVLDGREVLRSQVAIVPVPPNVAELVIASDGYPEMAPSLDEAERVLKALIAEDPLCIGPLAGTKGLRPGNTSYDDRSYLRLEI